MKTVLSRSFRLAYLSLVLLLALLSTAIALPSMTDAACPTTPQTYYTQFGPVTLTNSGLCILGATTYATNAMPCSTPVGYSFPYGMTQLTIRITSSNGIGTITEQLPNTLPLGVKFFNCVGGTLVDFTPQVTSVNEYTILITFNASGDYILGVGVPFNAPPQSSSATMPQTPQAPVSLSNITVKSASLSSAKVAPGEKVTVTANVANTGTGNGTSVVKVYVNGTEDASQGVTVTSGGTSSVTFNVARNEPGTYSVYVGGAQAGSFTVDEFTPNTVLFISGALVFFALVMGVIFMTRRRA